LNDASAGDVQLWPGAVIIGVGKHFQYGKVKALLLEGAKAAGGLAQTAGTGGKPVCPPFPSVQAVVKPGEATVFHKTPHQLVQLTVTVTHDRTFTVRGRTRGGRWWWGESGRPSAFGARPRPPFPSQAYVSDMAVLTTMFPDATDTENLVDALRMSDDAAGTISVDGGGVIVAFQAPVA
jgi:hypothetical protein